MNVSHASFAELCPSLDQIGGFAWSLGILWIPPVRDVFAIQVAGPQNENHQADGPKRATLNHPHSDLRRLDVSPLKKKMQKKHHLNQGITYQSCQVFFRFL